MKALCLRKCIWCNTQVSLFPVCCPGEPGAARLGCMCEMCPIDPHPPPLQLWPCPEKWLEVNGGRNRMANPGWQRRWPQECWHNVHLLEMSHHPLPLSIRQRAGRSAGTPAALPRWARPGSPRGHPGTCALPTLPLLPADASHTASLLRRQVTGGKSSGPALRSCRSGAPSQSPLRGRGPAPLYSIPSSQRKDLQDYSPHPTSPQQPQLLHNDSFCKPRVRGTKELVMHRVATSVCSTCSPHHALRSPLFLRGPHCQGDGDPVYGNCRPGLAAALLWAPSQIPGLPGLC